jgi:hypothetical protein
VSDFDPIDEWLHTDVELMPSRPGAFDRIHRKARRRKAIVAMSTAAGAAVMIAAAASIPQFASALLPGGGGPDKVGTSSSPQPPKPAPRHPAASHRHHPGQYSLSPPGAISSITNSAFRPAAGFRPASITFVSSSMGAAIGQTTSSCDAGSCTVVAGTTDYGQRWFAVDAPPAGPPDGSAGVSQIRFLDQDNGWAFGPELYATHDGGATWTKVTGLPGRVIDLATVGDSAFAVAATCTGSGAAYASDCTSFRLYSSPYDYDDWQPVPGAAADVAETPGGLQLTETNGYLLAGPVLFTGSPSGGAWNKVTISTGTVPACLDGHGHQASGESGLIAPSAASGLYLLCPSIAGGEPSLYESADAGQTWQPAGHADIGGTATSLALATTSDTLVAATSSGIYYSAGQASWHLATIEGTTPPDGFSFVGMTTEQQGVAVPADPAAGKIFITKDGGLTWQPSTI